MDHCVGRGDAQRPTWLRPKEGVIKSGEGPRAGNAIVSTDWADFYEETHVPAALRIADTLHVTGHTGDSSDGSYPADPEAQIRQTFANIAVTLAAAGATWKDVVSMTTYHVGLSSQRELLLTVARDFLQAPFPAWSAVGVSALWSPEAICEISCIAVLKGVSEPQSSTEEEAH
jgi:enamine deaminase RidA (YjgF/YER057c/UK114 family)